MRLLAQARNPYSLSWLWIPGSRFARPGMTPLVSASTKMNRSNLRRDLIGDGQPESCPAGREVPSGWRVCPALGAGTGAIANQLDSQAVERDAARTQRLRALSSARPIRSRSSGKDWAANARSKPMPRSARDQYDAASALHIGKSSYRCGVNNTGGRYGRRETCSGTDDGRDE